MRLDDILFLFSEGMSLKTRKHKVVSMIVF